MTPLKKLKRKENDEQLSKIIRAIRKQRPSWGYRSITKHLREYNKLLVGKNRIQRIIKENKIRKPKSNPQYKPGATMPHTYKAFLMRQLRKLKKDKEHEWENIAIELEVNIKTIHNWNKNIRRPSINKTNLLKVRNFLRDNNCKVTTKKYLHS